MPCGTDVLTVVLAMSPHGLFTLLHCTWIAFGKSGEIIPTRVKSLQDTRQSTCKLRTTKALTEISLFWILNSNNVFPIQSSPEPFAAEMRSVPFELIGIFNFKVTRSWMIVQDVPVSGNPTILANGKHAPSILKSISIHGVGAFLRT